MGKAGAVLRAGLFFFRPWGDFFQWQGGSQGGLSKPAGAASIRLSGQRWAALCWAALGKGGWQSGGGPSQPIRGRDASLAQAASAVLAWFCAFLVSLCAVHFRSLNQRGLGHSAEAAGHARLGGEGETSSRRGRPVAGGQQSYRIRVLRA